VKKFSIHLLIILLCSSCGVFSDRPRSEVEAIYAKESDGSSFVTISKMRVHIRDQGSKENPTLVMIHGISDSLHTWEHWAQELQKNYRVIRFDVPGFGLTDNVTEENFKPQFYNEFMAELFNVLEIDQAILIGNSLGGYISWNFALFKPSKVKALVLLDPAAYPLSPPWVVRIASTPIRSIAENFSPRWMTRSVAREVFYDDDKLSEQVVDRYHAMLMLDGARKGSMKVFSAINKFADKEPLGIENLKAPTLLLWGNRDQWINPNQIERWKKDGAGVQFIIFKDVGHAPQEEAPKMSLEAAIPFIESNR